LKVISIDPSSIKPAYCIAEGHLIQEFGQLPLHPLSAWINLMSDCDMMIMESQFFKVNISSLIKLTKSVGMIESIAYINDMQVIEIYPITWQSKLLGKHKRDALKKLSKLRASETTKTKIKSNDIADAINIAEYYYKFIEG